MAILIKVGKVPGKVDDYAVDGGTPTVKGALEAASLKMGPNDEVRVNGNPAALDTVVEDGNVVLLTPKIKGS